MPAPPRRARLRGTVLLATGDRLRVTLTPVGLDADGLEVYAPPWPIPAGLVCGLVTDLRPARSVIDLQYVRKTP